MFRVKTNRYMTLYFHIYDTDLNDYSNDTKILSGPDQILSSDADTAWEADGRVRIKLDSQVNDRYKPISVPGLLMRTASKYPNHPALISRPGVDGQRTTLTYKLVFCLLNKVFFTNE